MAAVWIIRKNIGTNLFIFQIYFVVRVKNFPNKCVKEETDFEPFLVHHFRIDRNVYKFDKVEAERQEKIAMGLISSDEDEVSQVASEVARQKHLRKPKIDIDIDSDTSSDSSSSSSSTSSSSSSSSSSTSSSRFEFLILLHINLRIFILIPSSCDLEIIIWILVNFKIIFEWGIVLL